MHVLEVPSLVGGGGYRPGGVGADPHCAFSLARPKNPCHCSLENSGRGAVPLFCVPPTYLVVFGVVGEGSGHDDGCVLGVHEALHEVVASLLHRLVAKFVQHILQNNVSGGNILPVHTMKTDRM